MSSPKLSSHPIYFHLEAPVRYRIRQIRLVKTWLNSVIVTEQKTAGNLNFILCTDNYLHQMNVEYLKHDTLTDVITFDNSEDPNSSTIEGDIFISIDRIKDNAKAFGVTTAKELNRVMVHGTLHLIGYGDKSPEEKIKMRAKEDFYLLELDNLIHLHQLN